MQHTVVRREVIDFQFQIEVILQNTQIEKILFRFQASVGPQVDLLVATEIRVFKQGLKGHISVFEILGLLREKIVVIVTSCKQKQRNKHTSMSPRRPG